MWPNVEVGNRTPVDAPKAGVAESGRIGGLPIGPAA
jgi:hypothetical protein